MTAKQHFIPAPRYRPTSYVQLHGLRCMVVDVLEDGGYVLCVVDNAATSMPKYTILLVERKLESELSPFNSH